MAKYADALIDLENKYTETFLGESYQSYNNSSGLILGRNCAEAISTGQLSAVLLSRVNSPVIVSIIWSLLLI